MISIRNGNLEDASWGARLINDASNAVHFEQEFPQNWKKILEGVTQSIRISSPRTNQSGEQIMISYFVDLWICQNSDKTPVGVFLVKSPEEPSVDFIYENRELWVAAIANEHQGSGYGSKRLDAVLNKYPLQTLSARCSSASLTMAEMLKRRGFKAVDENDNWSFLIRNA